MFQKFMIISIIWSLLLGATAQAEVVYLVDKAKFELHQADSTSNGFEIVKTYKTTLGKASGDKRVEGDLKTPEGIYRFTARYTQPQLKKKFGVMAFYMNYPNIFDKIEGKTGFDIMLHATDDPKRLELHQDSDGCVVVSNEILKEIEPNIRLQKTPIYVYEEMKPEYLKAEYGQDLKEALERWRKSWHEKDIETYIASYAGGFKFQKMDLHQYREYKASLNKKYESISVELSEIKTMVHPKYAIVSFLQKYSSTFPGGKTAYSSSGRKTLFMKKVDGVYKILIEDNQS